MSVLDGEIKGGVAVMIFYFRIRAVIKEHLDYLGLALGGGEHQRGKPFLPVTDVRVGAVIQ